MVRSRVSVAAVLALGLLTFPFEAHARRGGLAAAGCNGCHGGAETAKVSISVQPTTFGPGETVTARVSIESSGSGGMYLLSDVGKFTAIQGQSTSVLSDREVTHSAPKAGSGGTVTFEVRWTAPNEPSSVFFEAWTLSANGNGSSSGDTAGHGTGSAVYGCAGQPYYVDRDGDGHGEAGAMSALKCGPTPGFAPLVDDCDDFTQSIYPGAPELCNQRDDDCDGQADEGLATGSVTLYPDADGDGFGLGAGPTMTVTGCMIPMGYAAKPGDCNDRNASARPNAEEVCNLIDDNCDGRTDEGVRPRCGVGWCERLANTCNVMDCTPGTPSVEACNGADDDCNGMVDDGNLCGDGASCRSGECSVGSDPGPGPGPVAGAGAAGGGRGGSMGAGGAPMTGGTLGSGNQSGRAATGGGGSVSGAGGATVAGSEGARASDDADPSSGCATAPVRSGNRSGLALALGVSILVLRRRASRAPTSPELSRQPR